MKNEMVVEVMYYVIKGGQGSGRMVGFLYNSLDEGAKERKFRFLQSQYPVCDGYTLVEMEERVFMEKGSYVRQKTRVGF